MYLLSDSDRYRMVSTRHKRLDLSSAVSMCCLLFIFFYFQHLNTGSDCVITIQFVGAVDHRLCVSMCVPDEVYSILLAEQGPFRSGYNR